MDSTTRTNTTTTVDKARGGIGLGAILTGVVVAFGAMFLLSALVGGVIAALGIADSNVTEGDAIEAGIGAGIALVIAQLISYMWGGYAAGRMARGSGVANGLLVPLLAIVVGLIVVGVASALGATANLNLPLTTGQLPVEENALIEWGVGIGIASLIAMFLGGALGGGMGERWHTKLERHTHEERAERREVDLRDDARRTTTTPETTNTTSSGTTTGSR